MNTLGTIVPGSEVRSVKQVVPVRRSNLKGFGRLPRCYVSLPLSEIGLTDYSQVDILDLWYKSVKNGAKMLSDQNHMYLSWTKTHRSSGRDSGIKVDYQF